jgi:hypothetical protein
MWNLTAGGFYLSRGRLRNHSGKYLNPDTVLSISGVRKKLSRLDFVRARKLKSQ